MRIIKFRVWDNTKQQMFPVRELFWRENPYEMVGNYWFLENEDDEYGKEVWFPRTEANGSKHTASLMQFTGLTDKNGKEIYEGDIVERIFLHPVKGPYKQQAKVLWSGVRWWLEHLDIKPDGRMQADWLEDRWVMDCKVIGNIYEKNE